jgi:hypothetical protein
VKIKFGMKWPQAKNMKMHTNDSAPSHQTTKRKKTGDFEPRQNNYKKTNAEQGTLY